MSKPQVLSVEKALQFLGTQACGKDFPQIVTISGGTCAGKTTFADKLIYRLRHAGKSVEKVPLDAYFRDHDDPKFPQLDGIRSYDVPGAYLGSEFAKDVLALSKGSATAIPVYDMFTNKRLPQKLTLQPADVIIAEGIFAGSSLGHSRVKTLHIYMETPTDTCLDRRIERDAQTYSVMPDLVVRNFRKKILPYWHLHQKSEKTIAHLIVDGQQEGIE